MSREKDKYGKMVKPNFYCKNFIECHNNLPKHQPSNCNEQCHDCMDIIIDHHFNKKNNEQRATKGKLNRE